jgi:DNA-binding NarL/FixJ family response regulator
MNNTTVAKIRLLLIDDHALFREGISRLLSSEPDLEVVAACQTALAGLEILKTREIDVVLLDFDLGPERAIDFVRDSKIIQPSARILIVTAGVEESGAAADLIQAGVAGIFHKHNEPQNLSRKIRAVAQGDVHLEEVYLKSLFRMAQPETSSSRITFTERERSVLRFLLEGLANKEIADRLAASESAVKGIIQQLFQKTAVRTRSQLVRLALERYQDQL